MKEIPLNHNQVALVDDEDFELVSRYRWHAKQRGRTYYAIAELWSHGRRTSRRMHSLIMGSKAGRVVDHIDGNGLNNQRQNLRFATTSENLANRGPARNNTSGYKGVHWDTRQGRWRATIGVAGKRMHLGHFDSREAAARSYDEAARRWFGEFAKTNLEP